MKWGLCNQCGSDDDFPLQCINNRIVIVNALLVWETIQLMNRMLGDDEDYIMLSMVLDDAKVLSFIMQKLFDIVDVVDLVETVRF